MNRTGFLLLPPLLVWLSGCPSPDGETKLLDQEVVIEPMKFFRYDFQLEFPRRYRLVITPQGGDVDVIVRNGPSLGLLVVDNAPPGGSESVRDGTTRELTGGLAGGAATVNVVNRGAGAVRMKCQFVVFQKPEGGGGR
jgi:hypothetical protein